MRFVLLFATFTLTACSAVDQREPVPTSDFHARDNARAETTQADVAPRSDRIELQGSGIPVGTTLRLATVDPVSSATAKIGDRFRLRSQTAVVVNGVEVLPAGLDAYGEVIHADGRGLLGKPGELLLKLRALQWQGREIRLRNSVAGLANDKSGTALVTTILFGLAGLFVQGNEVEIPVATIVLGELAEPIPAADAR